MARRWFTEFLNDQRPEVDVTAKYFTPGVPIPDIPILKEYARYLVRSRVGQISSKLSINTVQHYMVVLIALMGRECKHPTLTAIQREMRDFIGSDLMSQEGLRDNMHTKAVAHSQDVTFILAMLYKPEYLNTFKDMRTVLNLTLYMLLIIDVCGRGGEIARHPLRPEHMCLRWEDIEFYTFQSDADSDFDICINVEIRWAKGQSLSEWKNGTLGTAQKSL